MRGRRQVHTLHKPNKNIRAMNCTTRVQGSQAAQQGSLTGFEARPTEPADVLREPAGHVRKGRDAPGLLLRQVPGVSHQQWCSLRQTATYRTRLPVDHGHFEPRRVKVAARCHINIHDGSGRKMVARQWTKGAPRRGRLVVACESQVKRTWFCTLSATTLCAGLTRSKPRP